MLDPVAGNALVFNGEIYNFKSLRAILVSKGHAFSSQTDTEVLLRGYAEWGADVFRRLEGMYALAIYDAGRKQLCLARDPMGIKPLYFHHGRGSIAFASEVRALIQSGVVERKVDRRALAGFLAYGSIQEPLTINEGIRMMPPGTMLQFDLTRPETVPVSTRFWTFPVPDTIPPCSRDEATEHIRELLDRAIESHLVSDVPVGVFLSGGLDSAVIAGFASRRHAATVHTYCVGLSDFQTLDESPDAEKTAREIGSTHVTIHMAEGDVIRHAQNWFHVMDQPSIDGLNTYIVAGAARECGIKVALSGLGGDELFGGYDHFSSLPRQQRLLQMLAVLPTPWRQRLPQVLLSDRSESIIRKAEDLLAVNPNSILELSMARRRLFSNKSLREFGFDGRELDLDDLWIDAQCAGGSQLPPAVNRDTIAAISVIESLFYMRNTLLRDTDVMGMAHGMELRVPLLDRRLVEFVGRLPGSWRVRQKGVAKPLLAEAGAAIVNTTAIAARKKRGFSLPYGAWMHGVLHAEIAGWIGQLRASGWMDTTRIDREWELFFNQPSDAGWSRIWSLAVLGHVVARSVAP